jgi:RNA-binding protein
MDTTSKKKLKAQAHSLKPFVMVGQSGLTPAVLQEIDIALNVHELIKIKIRADREARESISKKICHACSADLIQLIGQIAILYRLNPKKQNKIVTTTHSPRKQSRTPNRRQGLSR